MSNYKKIVILSLFVFNSMIGFAQTPILQWQKCLGGTGDEYVRSILQTTDGGYIAVGYTNSNNGDITNNNGGDDIWVVKLDYFGNIQWQNTYGASAGDQGYAIQQTSDGGYIVAGYSYDYNGNTNGNHGGQDIIILKLNSNGAVEWQKVYGGDDNEIAASIKQTTDGGYIIAGHTYSYDGVIKPVNGDVMDFHGGIDAWIVKINNVGVIEWSKTIGGGGNEEVFDIQQTTDGGYIAAGEHGIAYWLVKLSNTGDTQWQNIYTDCDSAYSVKQTADGGYIMAGDAANALYGVTSHNFGVIKVNSIGVIEWRHDYGGDGFFDIAYSIIQEPDGGYIVAGATDSYYSGDVGNTSGGQDYWIIKINNSGTIQWKKAIGGSNDDVATAIQRTTDGGYIVSGLTHSSNGVVTGFHGGYYDAWVVKLGYGSLGIDANEKAKVSIFPNPTKNLITIQTNNDNQKIDKIEVVDPTGKIVMTKKTDFNTFSISNLNTGIYFLHIYSNDNVIVEKIIKE